MRNTRPYPGLLLPIVLAILALVLFLVVPALTGGGKAGHRLPSAASTHR